MSAFNDTQSILRLVVHAVLLIAVLVALGALVYWIQSRPSASDKQGERKEGFLQEGGEGDITQLNRTASVAHACEMMLKRGSNREYYYDDKSLEALKDREMWVGNLKVSPVEVYRREEPLVVTNQNTVHRYFSKNAEAPAWIVVDGDMEIERGIKFGPESTKPFMVLYVNGNLTLDGTICMTRKGTSRWVGDMRSADLIVARGTYDSIKDPMIPNYGGKGGRGRCRAAGESGEHGRTVGGTGGGGGGGSGGSGSCYRMRGRSGGHGSAFGGGGGGEGKRGNSIVRPDWAGVGGVGGTVIVIVTGKVFGSGSIVADGSGDSDYMAGKAGGGTVMLLCNMMKGVISFSTRGGKVGGESGSRLGGAGGDGASVIMEGYVSSHQDPLKLQGGLQEYPPPDNVPQWNQWSKDMDDTVRSFNGGTYAKYKTEVTGAPYGNGRYVAWSNSIWRYDHKRGHARGVWPPSAAFSGNKGGSNHGWHTHTNHREYKKSNSSDVAPYLCITLPYAIRVASYSFTARSRCCPQQNPKEWTMYGSNDGGQNWVPIHTQADVPKGTTSEERTFLVDVGEGSSPFRTYKWEFTETRSGSLHIAKVRLFGKPPGAINAKNRDQERALDIPSMSEGERAAMKVAYSMKRLFKNYSGPLVRLRNIHTGNETDVFVDLDGEMMRNRGGGSQVVVWYDQSGYNHDLVLDRPALFTDPPRCLRFDGSNTYGYIKKLHYVSGETRLLDFTVAVWFRTSRDMNYQFGNWAFLDFDRSDFFNFYIRADSGTLALSHYDGSSHSLYDDHTGDTTANDGEWHHGVVVRNGTEKTLTFYLDGQLDASHKLSGMDTLTGRSGRTRYGFVGSGSEASEENGRRNSLYYEGDIAGIQYLEGKALSRDQVEDLYAATNTVRAA